MKLTVCRNPFDPTKDRTEIEADASTIDAKLEELGVERSRNVLCLNGEILPPERGLETIGPDDHVTVVPRLENSTLRIIAQLGVAAAAILASGPLGAFLAASVFTSLTTAQGVALAASLISVGGNLLVAGISSLFQKKPVPSYGWNGPQTTGQSGLPIPKGFGTMRSAGNIVMSWVDLQNADEDEHELDDGANDIGRSWINILVCFGFGPAKSITDIRINDKDIANYSDVAYFTRLGTNTQTSQTATDPSWQIINQTTNGTAPNLQPFTAFDRIVNNYPISQRVLCGITSSFITCRGQRPDTQRLDIVVQFPQGVWRIDGSGNIQRLTIYYDIYYRLVSPDRSSFGPWVLGSSHAYVNVRQTILRQITTIDSLPRGLYDVQVRKRGSGAVDNPMDAFEHESNKFGDELWIESVQETCYDALAYPNMILLGMRVMATGQLSGSNLQISAKVEYAARAPRPSQLASYNDDNPAIVAYDIHADPLVGGGASTGNIDVDALQEWADLCDSQVNDGNGGTQKLATFNGSFDQDGRTVWDAFQSVCVMSRATAIQVGTKVSVALDRPEDPVQMFHVGNIMKDSYSKKYLNLSDRAQEIEVDYANAADDYKTRTPLRVITAEDQGGAEVLKRSRVNLFGCTNTQQAWYWAYHKLLENKLKLRTHTWDSPAQGIISRIGNVAWLQHDVPQWANGGLIVGGTSSAVQLDRSDYDFAASSGYTLTVIHPVLWRQTVTVSNVSGNVISLTGFNVAPRVMRAVKGDLDVAITDKGANSITVESAVGFSNGDTIQLYDTDAIETVNITGYSNGVASVSPALSATPTSYAGYIYQSSTKNAIKVRIAGIKRTGDQKFTITAMDYVSDVYEIPPPSL
jgi:sulfur carrier protein ThiS